MIALIDGIPLVQLEDGQVVAFQREWLERSLLKAAAAAGYQKWWLAEHVTEGVVAYLALQFEANLVTVPALVEAVRSILQVIGYGDVAPYFSPGLPGVRLSLLELAREAGTGYELLFFQRLRGRLETLMSGGATFFELIGLNSCVKQLRAKKCWSRDCDALQAEIVSFVRTQTGTIVKDHEITVRLS